MGVTSSGTVDGSLTASKGVSPKLVLSTLLERLGPGRGGGRLLLQHHQGRAHVQPELCEAGARLAGLQQLGRSSAPLHRVPALEPVQPDGERGRRPARPVLPLPEDLPPAQAERGKHTQVDVWHVQVWRTLLPTDKSAFAVREHAGHSTKISLENVLQFDNRDRHILPTKGVTIRSTIELASFLGDSSFVKNELLVQVSIYCPRNVVSLPRRRPRSRWASSCPARCACRPSSTWATRRCTCWTARTWAARRTCAASP